MRRCRWCRTWYEPSQNDQKFCTTTCSSKWHSGTYRLRRRAREPATCTACGKEGWRTPIPLCIVCLETMWACCLRKVPHRTSYAARSMCASDQHPYDCMACGWWHVGGSTTTWKRERNRDVAAKVGDWCRRHDADLEELHVWTVQKYRRRNRQLAAAKEQHQAADGDEQHEEAC